MAVDIATVEVVGNALISVAREMGIALYRTAYSTIVRESMDCSAALFDKDGQLLAQAENIPSHLGSMGFSLKMLLKNYPWMSELGPGDCVVLNHPYMGGTHSPDITLFTAIVYRGQLVGFAGNIAHHVDVGGRAPGSMGNDVTDLYQEGLLIPPTKLLEGGKLNQTLIDIIRANVRDPHRTLGDLRAQIGANNTGVERITALFDKYGFETVKEVWTKRIDYVEKLARAQVQTIPDGEYEAEGHMDDDGIAVDKPVKIKVKIKIKGSDIVFDFTGTDPQTRGPINSVPPVIWSSCIYATRAVMNLDFPQNEGIFRVIDLVLPRGCFLNPVPPAPCGARHQTMQRLCDVLLHAFAKAMPGQIPAGSNAHATAVTCGGVHPKTGNR